MLYNSTISCVVKQPCGQTAVWSNICVVKGKSCMAELTLGI